MSGPQNSFEPHIEPKNSPIGPKNFKTTSKLSQNQMSELKETKKMKIIALYEWTQKQFKPDTSTHNCLFLPQKAKKKCPLIR